MFGHRNHGKSLINLWTILKHIHLPRPFPRAKSPLEVLQRWKCQHRCWKQRWGRNPTRTSKYTRHQIGSRHPASRIWCETCLRLSSNPSCNMHLFYMHDFDMCKILQNISKYLPKILNNPVSSTLQHEKNLDPCFTFTSNQRPHRWMVSFRIPIKLPQHPEPVQHSANQCNKNSTVKMAMQTLGVCKSKWWYQLHVHEKDPNNTSSSCCA